MKNMWRPFSAFFVVEIIRHCGFQIVGRLYYICLQSYVKILLGQHLTDVIIIIDGYGISEPIKNGDLKLKKRWLISMKSPNYWGTFIKQKYSF